MDHSTKPIAPHPHLRDYYQADKARQGFLNELFNKTAYQYRNIDKATGFGSGLWYRKKALQRAGLKSGMQVLDVACGPGLVAQCALELVGPSGCVIGLDPSIGMPLLMQFIKQAGEDYTLGEGQRRYNSRGQLVAENPNPSDKTGPFTDVGKLAEDYKSGSIDKAIYDAAMANLTSTRPDNGPRTAGGMYWDPNQKKWLNIPGYEETALRIAQAGAGNPGIVQSVHAIEGGKLLIVRRDGRTEVVTSDGKPVMDARTDPSAIFDRSAAASAGTQAGKEAIGA